MKAIVNTLSILLLGATTGYLMFQLKMINMLPNLYFWIVCGIFALLFLILSICMIRIKGWLGKILLFLLCLAISCASVFTGFYLQKTGETLSTVTNFQKKDEHYVSLISMSQSPYEKVEDIHGSVLGKLETLDSYATEQMVHDLESKGINYEVKEYASLEELVAALYTNEVDTIIFNEGYRVAIQDLDEYVEFDNDTKAVYTLKYVVEMEENKNRVDDITSKPFNVLITGTDSRFGVYATSRSDVNMVATINPQTGIVLLTSIPRDYYVPQVCSAAEGCPNGQLDKLTHTGNHGMDCVRKTIQSFMGIDISYSVKVSFDSVTNLVDAVGGIDIYSDQTIERPANGGHACVINEGMNHMDGACALSFARERHSYTQGDRHRIQNQQDVLIAIVKKALSPSMIINYPSFLEALNGTFITDIPMNDIQQLIQHQIQYNTPWKFEQYYLNGVGDWGYSAEWGGDLYMMYPDQETVKTGKEKIEAVLAGKSSETIQSVENNEKNAVKEGWEGY